MRPNYPIIIVSPDEPNEGQPRAPVSFSDLNLKRVSSDRLLGRAAAVLISNWNLKRKMATLADSQAATGTMNHIPAQKYQP